MNRVQEKRDKRNTRRRRIRARVHGTTERPRLAVFRSNKYLYAQIINDENGETIASASTKELKDNSAEALGAELAKRAKEKKIEKVVFDRGGYLFTGQIKTLADAARQAGLEF